MMSVLGYILGCAAAAALTGTAIGLVTVACVAALRPFTERLAAAVRSDLSLVAGLVPALAAVSTMAAVAAPSIGTALGFGPDHCNGHAHHFHICFIHSSGIHPTLASIGAFSLSIWLYRAASLVSRAVALTRKAGILERLGVLRAGPFPVFVLPGSRLCHATGLVRRRIMLSAEVAGELSPDELASALAHEEAHLRRRDPLATFLLAAAGLFVPPSLATRFKRFHRQAAEEACDAAAANEVGDGAIVAGALIKVAALQRASTGAELGASAFGTHGLERRVRALIDGPRSRSVRSRWCSLTLLVAASFVWLAFTGAESLHHAAETILANIF